MISIKPSRVLRLFQVLILGSSLLVSCTVLKKSAAGRNTEKRIEKSPVFSSYFAGFSLYDPASREYLVNVNHDKYFTPASNTKIITLAACLDLNQAQISSFRINRNTPTPRIQPMGDPVLLHPDFEDQRSFTWLRDLPYDTLYFVRPAYPISNYGPGWAWDDYPYGYQPERSWFPIYGNTVHIDITDSIYTLQPDFFSGFIDWESTSRSRARYYNVFNFPLSDYLGDTSEINLPFTVSEELVQSLLMDTLKKPIEFLEGRIDETGWQTIYGHDLLPILAVMMQRSDNFLAEQLLYNAQLTKGYQTEEAYARYLRENVFADLPDSLIWVDGSGLSRYNMFTPRSVVKILERIYQRISWEDITAIFPAGGVSGTIRNWYSADPEPPYVFAKTGTLRHNHCLSGYLVTRSGRKLIFSFMNNHYTTSSSEVKAAMQELLEEIRDSY